MPKIDNPRFRCRGNERELAAKMREMGRNDLAAWYMDLDRCCRKGWAVATEGVNPDTGEYVRSVDLKQCDRITSLYRRRSATPLRSFRPPRPSIRGLGQPPGATTRPPYCGTITALQQMLFDLGYYPGPVDGLYGRNTELAAAQFKREEGLGSGGIREIDCQRLIERWEWKKAQGVPPKDLPGTGPAMPTAFYQQARMRAPTAPTAEEQQAYSQTYDEGLLDSGSNTLARTKGWWDSQSTTTKVALIGGGVAVVGGIAYLATR